MKRTEKTIVEEIIVLLNELLEVSGIESGARVTFGGSATSKSKKDPKTTDKRGATGGIRILIEEGFFNQPRNLEEVISELQRIGRHYPKTTISMALLAQHKAKYLTRIGKRGKFSFAIRK